MNWKPNQLAIQKTYVQSITIEECRLCPILLTYMLTSYIFVKETLQYVPPGNDAGAGKLDNENGDANGGC